MSTRLLGGTAAASNSQASAQHGQRTPQRMAKVTESPLIAARVRADRACAAVNWILLAASLGTGLYFGNGLRVLVAGLPLAIVSTIMAFAMPGHLTTRLVSAITFMGSAALMIDIGHGQDKFHFVVFILIAASGLPRRSGHCVGHCGRVASATGLQLFPGVGLGRNRIHPDRT